MKKMPASPRPDVTSRSARERSGTPGAAIAGAPARLEQALLLVRDGLVEQADGRERRAGGGDDARDANDERRRLIVEEQRRGHQPVEDRSREDDGRALRARRL